MESINDILDFAIENEQEAIDFYLRMADKAKDKEMRIVFLEYADEEKSHKKKLLIVKEKGFFAEDIKHTENIIIEETAAFEDFNPELNLSHRQALIIAIQKEQAAYKLYKTLAMYAPNNYTRSLFKSLADEEASHKDRFQQEYDNYIINNN